MKFLVKQLQKGMMSYYGESDFLLVFLKQANIFDDFFSNYDDNDEFTIGDAALFAWTSRKLG